jgi:hypothetical protein
MPGSYAGDASPSKRISTVVAVATNGTEYMAQLRQWLQQVIFDGIGAEKILLAVLEPDGKLTFARAPTVLRISDAKAKLRV